MKLARPLFLIVALTAIVGFRSDETYTLKQKYKKDDVETYHAVLSASAEDLDIVFDLKNQYKVLSVEEDGAYEMEETLLEGSFKFNGEETTMEKSEGKVHKYDKDGKELKKADEEEEDEDPMSAVIEDVLDCAPDHAVKIGETWDRETEFTTVHVTLEGKEKVGDVECLKITMKATLSKKDTSGEVSGTFYVRVSDFSPEKMEATIENPKLDAETTMKKLEMKMDRIAN